MPATPHSQHAATSPMWRRVAFHALWLNAAWEAVQCWLFYDMGALAWPVGLAWMVAATVGDVIMVLAIWWIARRLRPSKNVPLMPIFFIGFGAGFALEWFARALNLWDYGALMPVLRMGQQTIGLLPVIQMTFLPIISVSFALRNVRRYL